MKKLNSLILSLALILLTGCEHLRNVNTYAPAAQIIAKDTTFFVLKKHPDWAPHFRTAQADLQVLAKSDAVDVAALAEIVARLPVEELKNDEARLVIGDVGILLQYIVPNKGTIIKEEHLDNVREVVIALDKGIGAGLSLQGL
jgi:hypothetical protein